LKRAPGLAEGKGAGDAPETLLDQVNSPFH